MNILYTKVKNKKMFCSFTENGISNIQNYCPIFNNFFILKENNFNHVSLKSQLQLVDIETIKDTISGEVFKEDIFIKYAPLLDPFRFIIGKYKTMETVLPTLEIAPKGSNPKLYDEMNCSYTEMLFVYLNNILIEKYKFPNAVKFYGTFSAIQNQYSFDITEDMEYLEDCSYFLHHKGTLFDVFEKNKKGNKQTCTYLKNKKQQPNILDIYQDDVQTDEFDVETLENEEVAEGKGEEEEEEDATSIVSVDNLLKDEEDDNEEEDDYDDDYDSDEDDSTVDSMDSNDTSETMDSNDTSETMDTSYTSETMNTMDEIETKNEELKTILNNPDIQETDLENVENTLDELETDLQKKLDLEKENVIEENDLEFEEDLEEEDLEEEDLEEEDLEEEDLEEEDLEEEDQESTVYSTCSSSDNSFLHNGSSYEATISNFPVQIIAMEKCLHTLDHLINTKQFKTDQEWFAMLMQVIMTLIAFQKCFHFTHNDLHTNNIMYITTEEEFLYYKFENIVYRVPTFGKIFKVIDFGRSIYELNKKRYFSDCFSKGNDASTQYNTEPFYDSKKPRVDPNPSFDLCRLACSMIDFFILSDDDLKQTFNPAKIKNPVFRLISEWCIDDSKKSVLYKRSGEERYPDFLLYKKIARNVHSHTPRLQLERSEFTDFIFVRNLDETDHDVVLPIVDIDIMAEYS